MTTTVHSILFGLLSLAATSGDVSREKLRLNDSRFEIEVPNTVLTDVPVSRIVIKALDLERNVDTSFNERVLVTGVVVTKHGQEVALDPFRQGILELTTDLAEGRKVYITGTEILVDPDSRRRGRLSVLRMQRWFSLIPPLLAVLLAIWMRNVILSLFVAVWSGAVILAHGDFFAGFVRTLDTYLIGELVQPGQSEHSHIMIILFTMFLGATVGVMSRSGGTLALVDRLSRFIKNREHGQLMTMALGVVIFFDDYANTLLVGSTMRPVTDRLKISREKLAFLVDSTAAPIAGLAVISTWVGVEISYISDTYTRLGMSGDVYTTFLATIPYRFYPLHLLVFVWLIAYSGNDYGPMLKAEVRALSQGHVCRPEAMVISFEDTELSGEHARRRLVRNALLPLAALLALMVIGLWWVGTEKLEVINRQAASNGEPEITASVWTILSHSSPNRVLFLSSFLASVVAVAGAVISRSLTVRESIDAWAAGAKSMFFAILILVMAWSVATLCDGDHLNTSGFLVELTTGHLSVTWMPALAFLLSAFVSFATGSSWSTMGLLMPLFISVTYQLLLQNNDADPNHHLMLATIGAVLSGAIFGDHCSPISDTTVLSSAAAGSDHLDHVATQLPYAVSVGLVALFFGYIPVGFGYSPVVLLPFGLIVLYILVQFLGRSVEECSKQAEEFVVADPPGGEPLKGDFDDAEASVPEQTATDT